MTYVKLNNGIEMPILGFGVYQIEESHCEQVVYDAIMAGYRLIDTAAAYVNEKAVGQAIKRSGIPRKEFFITTKLWIQNQGYETVKVAFQKSLERLQLDYVDMYMIHQPFGDYYGSWRAMEELYREGKARSIAVSNFYPDRLVDFISHHTVVPAVNQIEVHPFTQQIENHKLMKEYGVQMEAWGPLAEGKNNIFQNEMLVGLASKHNKSVAQIVLRWNIQNSVVIIPKSVHKDRIAENINVFDFELTADDMERIAELDMKKNLLANLYDPALAKKLCESKYDI